MCLIHRIIRPTVKKKLNRADGSLASYNIGSKKNNLGQLHYFEPIWQLARELSILLRWFFHSWSDNSIDKKLNISDKIMLVLSPTRLVPSPKRPVRCPDSSPILFVIQSYFTRQWCIHSLPTCISGTLLSGRMIVLAHRMHSTSDCTVYIGEYHQS